MIKWDLLLGCKGGLIFAKQSGRLGGSVGFSVRLQLRSYLPVHGFEPALDFVSPSLCPSPTQSLSQK